MFDLGSSNNKSWMLESPPHSGMKSDFESSEPINCRASDTQQQNSQSEIFLQKRIKKIKQGMKKWVFHISIHLALRTDMAASTLTEKLLILN